MAPLTSCVLPAQASQPSQISLRSSWELLYIRRQPRRIMRAFVCPNRRPVAPTSASGQRSSPSLGSNTAACRRPSCGGGHAISTNGHDIAPRGWQNSSRPVAGRRRRSAPQVSAKGPSSGSLMDAAGESFSFASGEGDGPIRTEETRSPLPPRAYDVYRKHVLQHHTLARVMYFAQKVLVSPFWLKAVVLLGLSILTGLAAGLMSAWMCGGRLRDSIWQAFTVMNNCPGADMCSVETLAAKAFMVAIFYVGIFTLATFLGIMADEVRNRMDMVKAGNDPILEDDHNVIIGSSRLLIPLLVQASRMAKDMPTCTWTKPVVLLLPDAETRERAEAAVTDAIRQSRLQVIYRTGHPTILSDLARVRAGVARTVIYLDPNDSQDYRKVSLEKAATTMALNALRHTQENETRQNMVLQTSAFSGGELMFRAHQEYANQYSKMMGVAKLDEAVGTLLAVCSLQPGLAGVYTNLFEVNPGLQTQVHITQVTEEMIGKRHGQLWRSFPEAVVLGYLHDTYKEDPPSEDLSGSFCEYRSQKSHSLSLNPPDSLVIESGDKVLVACQKSEHVNQFASLLFGSPAQRQPDEEPPQEHVEPKAAPQRPYHVAVLDCDPFLPALLEAMCVFAPEGTRVSVLSQGASGDSLKDLQSSACSRGISVEFTIGDCTDEAALVAAGVTTCDAAVVGNMCTAVDQDGADDHDGLLLNILMLIKRVREGVLDPSEEVRGRVFFPPLHTKLRVLGLSRFPDTQLVADVLASGSQAPMSIDLLNLDTLMGGWIAQVAAQPELTLFFRELLTTAVGCELYLRDARPYVVEQARRQGLRTSLEAISFREVQDKVRERSETAIGFIRARTQQVMLGMDTAEMVSVYDRVIVLAED